MSKTRPALKGLDYKYKLHQVVRLPFRESNEYGVAFH